MAHLNNISRNAKKEKLIVRRLISEEDLKLTVALTDSSRRSIIELLNKSQQGLTAKNLAERLDLKISTVMSHLRILKDVGAVRSEKRTGKRVKRSLNRYYSLVEVKTTEQITEAVEEAVDVFGDYMIDAALDFLKDNRGLVPKTSNPYVIADWLDALVSETSDYIPDNAIFIYNDELVKLKRYRKLALFAAKVMLFNDFMFLLTSYATDLYEKNPSLIERIAREHSHIEIKPEDGLLFLVESMFSIIYDPADEIAEAKNVVQRVLKALPDEHHYKLIQFWPYVMETRLIPNRIKDKILTFFFFGDEDEILERCNENLRIIKKFGG